MKKVSKVSKVPGVSEKSEGNDTLGTPDTTDTVTSGIPATRQVGQILIFALIILSLVVVTTVVLINGSLTFFKNSNYSVDKVQATNLAEAGIDRAVAALNATGGTYTGETETALGDGSYSVAITSIDSSTSLVKATGYIPNKTKPTSTKTVQVQVSKGNGVSFSYGVLVGQGGFDLSGGSIINGTVYSNGNITLSGGGRINGNAYVARGTSPTADQDSNTCSGTSCQDYDFGLSVTGERRYDVTQGFKPSTPNGTVINKVSLMVKKKGVINTGSHPDLPVKLVSDNAGKPSKTILASGTLSSSQVTGTYGWVDVNLAPAVTLNQNTQYWIIIDTCGTSTNGCDSLPSYWSWQRDSLGGYPISKGKPGWAPRWDANPNPTWTQNLVGNLALRTYMGGAVTFISASGASPITGSAYANTLNASVTSALQIGQEAYYQSIDSNVRVSGAACSGANIHCHPGATDPDPALMPISDSNINDWKVLAQAQGTTNGNVTVAWPCTTILKGYYSGNVTLAGGGCQGALAIKMKTPIYIAGNLSMSGGAELKLDSVYGAQSGVIVTDGRVDFSGGSNIKGTGDPNSLMLVLSTYDSPGGVAAITTSGGNVSSVLYAGNGVINISGGGSLYEVVAQKLSVSGGGTVNYQSGIPVPQLPSGPSGSYAVIKGTYQSK